MTYNELNPFRSVMRDEIFSSFNDETMPEEAAFMTNEELAEVYRIQNGHSPPPIFRENGHGYLAVYDEFEEAELADPQALALTFLSEAL